MLDRTGVGLVDLCEILLFLKFLLIVLWWRSYYSYFKRFSYCIIRNLLFSLLLSRIIVILPPFLKKKWRTEKIVDLNYANFFQPLTKCLICINTWAIACSNTSILFLVNFSKCSLTRYTQTTTGTRPRFLVLGTIRTTSSSTEVRPPPAYSREKKS